MLQDEDTPPPSHARAGNDTRRRRRRHRDDAARRHALREQRPRPVEPRLRRLAQSVLGPTRRGPGSGALVAGALKEFVQLRGERVELSLRRRLREVVQLPLVGGAVVVLDKVDLGEVKVWNYNDGKS